MQVVKLGKKKGDFYSIENNIKKRQNSSDGLPSISNNWKDSKVDVTTKTVKSARYTIVTDGNKAERRMNNTTNEVQEPAFITNVKFQEDSQLPILTFSQVLPTTGETEDDMNLTLYEELA